MTDPGVKAAGILQKALDALPGMTVAVFDQTPSNPTEAAVRAAVDVFKANNCDGLIAVGGGSSIDLAKGVAIALVVLGHAKGIPPAFTVLAYSFHVPLFFLLSGWLSHRRSAYPVPRMLQTLARTLLGTDVTKKALLPGGSTKVTLIVPAPMDDMTQDYYVEVDEASKGDGAVLECDENNNGGQTTMASCPKPG